LRVLDYFDERRVPTWAIAVPRRFARATIDARNPVNNAAAPATLDQEAAERDDWLNAGVDTGAELRD
jgi:hypothetical protein